MTPSLSAQLRIINYNSTPGKYNIRQDHWGSRITIRKEGSSSVWKLMFIPDDWSYPTMYKPIFSKLYDCWNLPNLPQNVGTLNVKRMLMPVRVRSEPDCVWERERRGARLRDSVGFLSVQVFFSTESQNLKLSGFWSIIHISAIVVQGTGTQVYILSWTFIIHPQHSKNSNFELNISPLAIQF